MGKVRIHELAKKIGKPAGKLLEELKAAGYDVKATVSMIDESVVDSKGNVLTFQKNVGLGKEKPEEEIKKPKEPEQLKITTQGQVEGGRRIFRVSKSLKQIKEENLLPPPPPPKVEEKEEKKEVITPKIVIKKKVDSSFKKEIEKVEIPEVLEKKQEEVTEKLKDEEVTKSEKEVQPFPSQEKEVFEKEEERQETRPRILHSINIKKKKEEIRKVVLPKKPPKEPSQIYIHKPTPKKVEKKEEEKQLTKQELFVEEQKIVEKDEASPKPVSEKKEHKIVQLPEKEEEKSPEQLAPITPISIRAAEPKKKSKRDKRLEKFQAKQEREERIEQEFLKDQEMAEKGEAVFIREGITVKELSEKINVKVKDIIQKFMMRGIFLTINQPLNSELAIQICSSFGYQAEIISFEDEIMMSQETPREGEKITRAPIVTVMGHVDHGKSSLLEAIHNIEITSREHGGITQHIGAYKVKYKEREFVFLDTPGHEAFTMMRARGAKVTDIVILVVAADDGVMPQTVEAINHCKAAKVPIIVAINKIDKLGVAIDRIKQDLMAYGVVGEEFGGDTVMVPISAKKRIGIDDLLDMLSLTADMMNLQAVPNSQGTGTVLEAKLDKARGAVATVIVQDGKVKITDVFLCGSTWGRVRQIYSDKGEKLEEAGPSTPVEILGFTEVPNVGSIFQVVETEGLARQISTFRKEKEKQQALQKKKISLENVFGAIKDGELQELSVILKADVQGSIEALSKQLVDLSNEEVKVNIVHSGVGAVTESDVLLASASNAVIIAFNVRPDKKAVELAKVEGVETKTFTVIYNLIDEIKQAITGMLKPIEKEIIHGHCEIKEVFKIGGIGAVAGCIVIDGKISRSSKIRVLRDNVVIYKSSIKSLKRFKDDVSEVKEGLECGIGIENFNDIKVGDILEAYEILTEERG